jgi:hypothetical protein
MSGEREAVEARARALMEMRLAKMVKFPDDVPGWMADFSLAENAEKDRELEAWRLSAKHFKLAVGLTESATQADYVNRIEQLKAAKAENAELTHELEAIRGKKRMIDLPTVEEGLKKIGVDCSLEVKADSVKWTAKNRAAEAAKAEVAKLSRVLKAIAYKYVGSPAAKEAWAALNPGAAKEGL